MKRTEVMNDGLFVVSAALYRFYELIYINKAKCAIPKFQIQVESSPGFMFTRDETEFKN